MSDPFWMIYGMGQGSPTARHHSFETAKAEAERLARVCPGTEFYVLQTVGVAKKTDVDFRHISKDGPSSTDDLPF